MSERSMEKTGRRPRGIVTPEKVEMMRRLRRQGYQMRDVAYEAGVDLDTVSRYTAHEPRPRSRYESNPPTGRRVQIERNPERNAAIVEACRTRALPDVAGDFGVSRERVRQIIVAHERRTGESIPIPPCATRPPCVRRLRPTLAQILLRHARLNPETGCWRWTGALHQTGDWAAKPASQTAVRFGLSQIVYRATFQLWRGPLGAEHVVPAVCGDWLCINPYHWQREVEVLRGED